MAVTIKTPPEIEKMRVAGRLAGEVLQMIRPHVQPGITTGELDRICHDYIVNEQQAIPAPLNYRGFPKSICTSINHVVCHGIPGEPIPKSGAETNSKDHEKRRIDDRLTEGDILNIDVTVIVDGWYGDTSRMYVAGKPPRKMLQLIDVTHDALMLGIEAAKPGHTFGDIGHAIQRHAEGERCSVVRDFCGHGLGRVFHDLPNVVHFGRPGEGAVLRPGMFFTIEPMVNVGTWETKILSNGWTAVTRDRQASAQFEHSIGVTADGCEIFTLSPKGLHKPPYR